jgi:hypothetical protein
MNQSWLKNADQWCIRVGVGISSLGLLTLVSTMVVGLPTQAMATIEVATDPPSATVQIDGQTIGQTPISTSLPEGEHDLIISKAGFKIIDRKIYVDPSAPTNSNQYAFALMPTDGAPSPAEKGKQIQAFKRQAEEAFKRGDYVAPASDSAWHYVNKLQEFSPTDPFIEEMRQRIRRTLKQQAEMTRPRNDLG